MRPCKKCGNALSNQLKVCPECGAEQVKTVGTHATDDEQWQEHHRQLQEEPDETLLAATLLQFIPLIPLILFPGIGWLGWGAVGFKYGLAFGLTLFAISIAAFGV